MNNNIKSKNLEEVTIQLNKAEVKKKVLINNIFKEYEIYFQIVRKSLLTSTEKGIFSLLSEIPISESALNTTELNNFFKKDISLLIYSKLPLLTIEQLKLGDISHTQKKYINVNGLTELIEFKLINFEDKDDLINNNSLEFHSNNNLNTYDYYESLSDNKFSSINLDENNYLNCFSNSNTLKKGEYSGSFIEDTNNFRYNDNKNIKDKFDDVFISSNDYNVFELIDRSFSNLLSKFSYEINLQLYRINLLTKVIPEDTFKYLSNSNYLIRHPYPFVVKCALNQNDLSLEYKKSPNIYLFNISDIELEFHNLELSVCRNNINDLKNKFMLLNKKERYWKNKELNYNNLN